MTSTVAFAAKSITPTPEQLAVQTASAQTLLIEANAGAAKTTTLALRMAESWQRGTAPDAFLALVHTDTACLALHAALRKIGVPAPVRQRMRIATFEQFCTRMLADPGARAVPVPVLVGPVIAVTMQATATLVMLAAPTVPEPLVTEHVWPVGCVPTVTL